MLFKVGDRVRMTEKSVSVNEEFRKAFRENIGTIVDIKDNATLVLDYPKSLHGQTTYTCHFSHFEKAEYKLPDNLFRI